MIKIDDMTIVRGGKKLFENFSLDLEENKITALIAPSGTGKTTLLKTIASENKNVSFLFQEPRLLPWYSIRKNIEIVLENCMPCNEAKLRAEKYLAKTGLIERADEKPAKLSGGEKQRVAMARAFAFPSSVLLLDEAFQSQDLKLRISLMEMLLGMIASEPRTVLMVTHDVREAGCLADKIVVLSGTPLKIDDVLALPFDERSVSEKFINPQNEIIKLERNLLNK